MSVLKSHKYIVKFILSGTLKVHLEVSYCENTTSVRLSMMHEKKFKIILSEAVNG